MAFSWQNIHKPLVALAPMSGVSDIAMRSIARRLGSDITFSEFISSDALYYRPDNEKCFLLAKFIEEERPFIIQLFGSEPEHFEAAVKVLNERLHPDGFDINFGCPARSVVGNGAGSCLFLKPSLAKAIVHAVKEASGGLPTSIKLRASYRHVSCLEFLSGIEGAPFENVTVHMRSYEQVHHGEPNWDVGRDVVRYFAGRGVSVLVNGGIDSAEKAKAVLAYTDADGVMLAQASLGNPFIFAQIKAALSGRPLPSPSYQERVQTVLEHARLMVEHKGSHGMVEMRKHLLWYFRGFPNAKDLRQQLSQVQDYGQLEAILAAVPAPT